MAKLNLFTGTLLKEIVASPINGEISVIKSVAFGTYIQVGNLTQSGGVVYGIWNKTLRQVSKSVSEVSDSLILGLGGGSVAKVMKKYWPKAKITGVDLDPKMVEMGTKYLGFEKAGVKVVIGDALAFLKKSVKSKKKYDLVCTDLYIGDEFPKKFEEFEFIELVYKVLSPGSSAVFNRLYYDEKRKQAMKFSEKLQKIFSQVNPIFPEANVMFFCKK